MSETRKHVLDLRTTRKIGTNPIREKHLRQISKLEPETERGGITRCYHRPNWLGKQGQSYVSCKHTRTKALKAPTPTRSGVWCVAFCLVVQCLSVSLYLLWGHPLIFVLPSGHDVQERLSPNSFTQFSYTTHPCTCTYTHLKNLFRNIYLVPKTNAIGMPVQKTKRIKATIPSRNYISPAALCDRHAFDVHRVLGDKLSHPSSKIICTWTYTPTAVAIKSNGENRG